MDKLTLNELFRKGVDTYKDRVAFMYSEKGKIQGITFEEWEARVLQCARVLAALGVSQGERVAMISEKCPEQASLFFAVWQCGAVAVPICETFAEETQAYILRDSRARWIVTSDKFKEQVDRVVTWDTQVERVLLFKELLTRDVSGPSPSCDVSVDDLSILVYTSGSTGHPKGVMLSHLNMTTNSIIAIRAVGSGTNNIVASVLPYWHCFALSTEMFTPLVVGYTVYVPRDKLEFQRNIGKVRPTMVLSVPRIAETIRASVLKKLESNPPWQRRLFEKALSLNTKRWKEGLSLPEAILRPLLDKLIMTKVREAFGGRIRMFVGGGAPLAAELQEFFMGIGMPMLQGYGLTEASPVVSANTLTSCQIGTSGQMLPWLTPEEGGDYTFEAEDGRRGKDLQGELLLKGDCVMMGYWNSVEKTCDVIDEGGWLHTKDMGHMNGDGFLMLHGRKSSLICLKNGEKLYPEIVEETLKLSRYITQAVLVGEGHVHCSVLLNVDESLINIPPSPREMDLLESEVHRLCAHFDRHMRPHRVHVVPAFTQENGLLTASLKVRRHKVMEIHADDIDSLSTA